MILRQTIKYEKSMRKKWTLHSERDSSLTVFEQDNSQKLLQLFIYEQKKSMHLTVTTLLSNHIETFFAIILIPLVIPITVRKLMYSNSNSRLQMVTC